MKVAAHRELRPSSHRRARLARGEFGDTILINELSDIEWLSSLLRCLLPDLQVLSKRFREGPPSAQHLVRSPRHVCTPDLRLPFAIQDLSRSSS